MERIVTLTTAAALDVSFEVERLVPNRKLRTTRPAMSVGGGGLNVARAIRRLGGVARALWCAGGADADRMSALLREEGVPEHALRIADEVRRNFFISERASGSSFRLNAPAARVTEAESRALLEQVTSLDGAEYLVLSGRLAPGLPVDFYARVARCAPRGTRIVLDAQGAALKAATGSGVFLMKPNERELSELAGRELHGDDERAEASRELIERDGIEALAVSLGAGGVLLVTRAGAERVRPPQIEPVSDLGAGDSTVAGIVLGLTQGMSLPTAVRFGTAAGTAAVLNPGTELCSREDTERLFAEILLHCRGTGQVR